MPSSCVGLTDQNILQLVIGFLVAVAYLPILPVYNLLPTCLPIPFRRILGSSGIHFTTRLIPLSHLLAYLPAYSIPSGKVVKST